MRSIHWNNFRLLNQLEWLIFSVILTVFGGACSGTLVKDESRDGGEEDDVDVVEPVSMALFGPEYIASVRSTLSKSITSGTYKDMPGSGDSVRSSGTKIEVDNNSISTQILAAPSLAAGEMDTLLSTVQSLQDFLFGSNGVLKSQHDSTTNGINIEVLIGNSEGFRTFVLPTTSNSSYPRYAEVYYQKSADYSYIVHLYVPTSTSGLYERTTSLYFKPDASNKNQGKGKIIYNAAIANTSLRQHLEIHYDTIRNELIAIFGTNPHEQTKPAKTIITYNYNKTVDAAQLNGAYVWKRDAVSLPENSIAPVRYYYLKTGDIEIFRSLGKKSQEAEAAQSMAFIPVEQISYVTYRPAKEVFDNYTYLPHMMAFIIELIRNNGVNSNCANAAAAFQAAFTSNTPASVASLSALSNNSFCKDNSVVTNSLVDQVVTDTCDANKSIKLTVTLTSGQTTYDLCARYAEAKVLKNNQYLKTDTSANTREVLTASQITNTHTTLESELIKLNFMDFSTLADVNWPQVTTKQQEEFKNVESTK